MHVLWLVVAWVVCGALGALIPPMWWDLFGGRSWWGRRRAARRERIIANMRAATNGLQVIQLAHSINMPQREWSPFWDDAYDREHGRRPRSEVAAERAAAAQLPRVPRFEIPYFFSPDIQQGSGPKPPSPPEEPMELIPLSGLVADMQQAGLERVKYWIAEGRKKMDGSPPKQAGVTGAVQSARDFIEMRRALGRAVETPSADDYRQLMEQAQRQQAVNANHAAELEAIRRQTMPPPMALPRVPTPAFPITQRPIMYQTYTDTAGTIYPDMSVPPVPYWMADSGSST